MRRDFLLGCGLLAWAVPAAVGFDLGSTFENQTNYVLAFGDSYTYVQGTLGKQNYSFIGSLIDFEFTPAQLLSDRIVQDQISTSAGGPNYVQHLTNCTEGHPKKCPIQLWDFAFAGSDVTEDMWDHLHFHA